MDAANILKALDAAMTIATALEAAITKANALISKVRAEGRDITDAELDELKRDRDATMDRLRAKAQG